MTANLARLARDLECAARMLRGTEAPADAFDSPFARVCKVARQLPEPSDSDRASIHTGNEGAAKILELAARLLRSPRVRRSDWPVIADYLADVEAYLAARHDEQRAARAA